MPRLSAAHDRALRQVADLARRTLLPEELAERALDAVASVTSASGQTFGMDPDTLLFDRLLAATTGMEEHARWFLRHHYMREPVPELEHAALMREGRAVVCIQETPDRSWGVPQEVRERFDAATWRRLYQEREVPAGGVLRTYLRSRGLWLGAVILARFDATRPFRPAEVTLMRLIAPTLGRALGNALERERALRGEDLGPAAPGVVLIDADDRIERSTPAADVWLRLLRDEKTRMDELPYAVRSALAALRGPTDPRRPFASARVTTRAGAVEIETTHGSDSGTAAVLIRAVRRKHAGAVPPAWPVTATERRVVARASRGMTDREIAADLSVSETTHCDAPRARLREARRARADRTPRATARG